MPINNSTNGRIIRNRLNMIYLCVLQIFYMFFSDADSTTSCGRVVKAPKKYKYVFGKRRKNRKKNNITVDTTLDALPDDMVTNKTPTTSLVPNTSEVDSSDGETGEETQYTELTLATETEENTTYTETEHNTTYTVQ